MIRIYYLCIPLICKDKVYGFIATVWLPGLLNLQSERMLTFQLVSCAMLTVFQVLLPTLLSCALPDRRTVHLWKRGTIIQHLL